MNRLIKTQILPLSLFIILFTLSCGSTESVIKESENNVDMDDKYDSALAEKLGADTYGMKKYVLANLKRGPNRDLSKEEAMALQKKHLENIAQMAEAGKLWLAGPFLDDGDIRGIYIFNVETIEEAEALVNTDPAIKAGSLEMELRPWYGTAALGMVNEYHSRLQKANVADQF